MSTQEILHIINEQIETIRIMLERPVVQRQLLAILLAILLATFISRGLYNLVRQRLLPTIKDQMEEASQRLLKRWLPATRQLYFPITAMLTAWIVISFFETADHPAGLLRDSQFILWMVLAYRLIAALFYILLGEDRADNYHDRIFLPVFLWITAGRVINNFINLSLLAQIHLTTLSETPITLGKLISAIIVFYLFLVLSWAAKDLIVTNVMPHTEVNPGVVNSVVAITRYLVIIFGLVAALGTLGFSLSTLAFIGGGLSIGVGFGLQQIIANFVSGILLLFEDSLRPGDVVEIGGEIGTVQKLSIRSTLIRTNDNVELIIPNENLLTSTVKAFTKSSRLVRMALDIGVAYNTDIKKAHHLLLKAAHSHPIVKDDPEPAIFLANFGESSINFKLLVWVDEPSEMARVRSQLNYAIWEQFSANGIEIPFPQRTIHLPQPTPTDDQN